MASSYGDRYGREGPSELQKLYGSNLPPSLRYGAVRQSRAPRSQEPQNQGTPPVNEKTTTSVPDVVKRADDYKKSRARSEPVSTPNVHVPKARKSAPQKSSRPILQIKDIPEYADYPGGKYAFRDEDNVSASEPQLAYYRKRPRDPHAMKQKVVGVLRHGLKEEQSDNLKRQAAATTFLERINAKKEQRRHQATVVDAESEKEDAQPDSEAGKRQDLEDEEPTLGSPEPVPSADVAQSIKALESELEELKFQREMSRRLRDLGYTEQTIEIMVDKDKMNKFKADVNRSDRPSNYTQPPRAPVYPKVHKSYLAPETLRYYDLPWEYDRSDSDYIIILRDLSKSETDVLFEHTTRLRSGKLLFEPLERGRSKKTFSFHNREDRGASRKDVVVHRDRSKSGSETSSEDDSDIDDFIDDEIGRTFAWYETSDDLGILELGQDSAEDEPPAGLGSWFRKRKDVLQDVPQINAIGEEAPSHSRFRALALDEPDQAIEMTDTSKLDTHYPRPRGENSSASEKVIYSCYGKDWTGSSSESAGHPGLIVTSGMKDNHKDALYYLRHIRQDILDFHSYIEQVLEMSELRKVTRPLREHLKEVQISYEKSPQNGSYHRYMEPFCHTSQTSQYGGTRFLSMCIPFLVPQRHNHSTEAKRNLHHLLRRLLGRSTSKNPTRDFEAHEKATLHPMRTLFQTIDPRRPSRNDLKQVICHMSEPRSQSYLCVSQVWVLIVNEELLITCSILPETELYGSLAKRSVPPIPSSLKSTASHIRVQTPDKRLWLLGLADCDSYLGFVSHFFEITKQFVDDFEIALNDEIVQPHQWPALVRQAARSSDIFVLKERSSSSIALRAPAWDAVKNQLSTKWFPFQEQKFDDDDDTDEDDDRSEDNDADGDVSTESNRRGDTDDTSDGEDDTVNQRGDPGGDPDAAHEDHMVAGAEADAESQAVVQETSAYQQYQGQGNGRNQDARQDAVNDDNEKEVLQQTIPQQSGEHEADLERSSSIAMPANQKEFQRQQAYSGDGSRSPSQSRASSASEVSEDDSDIFEVPKPFIDRAVLDALRLKYEEREGNYVVQKPVSMEQWKTVIAKSVNLTLEGIRMATQSSLLQHNNFDQKLLAASPSIEMNLYRPSKDAKKLSPDVDDIELYSQYQGISDDTFNQRVAALFDTPPNVDKSSTLAIGPTKAQPALRRMQVSQLCSILGYTALTQRDDTTAEDVELTPLDGSLYANLLNGLRSLLRFLASEESDDNKDEDWSKLLVSIVENLEVIDQTLQPEASAATIVILRKMCSGLHHLFRSLRDLELYSVTHQSLGSTDAGDLSECRRAMRHTVLALLRTAQASRGIARVVPVIESWEPHSARALSRGIVKQFFRTACSKSQWIGLQSSDLYVTGDTFQKQFSNYARRLSELGWSKEAAEFLLENGCSWKQAALHAKQAQSLLEKAFRGALASHPDRSIRWKAAAFPSDTIILLLPDILLRPVLDGQGALDMYYRYVTDLYSTILMGEPSRESLERIRHLRAELNAVSLLQTDQLKMLEQYAEAIFPQHKDGDPSEQFRIESDPHPGYRMLRALRKGIATQNDGIQELNNSLDNLQTEAQSQISGVQDWRDNAVVVFTIITIIFLPLSFISSVFGMNTADVRNMNHNQWVFWASAAPFTLAVIMITLWFVDVPPLWRWLERHGSAESEQQRLHFTGSTGSRANIFADLVAKQEGAAEFSAEVEKESRPKRGRAKILKSTNFRQKERTPSPEPEPPRWPTPPPPPPPPFS